MQDSPNLNEGSLEAVLIFFDRDFSPREPVIRSVLTMMTVRGRPYRQWMTKQTRVGSATHPKAQEPHVALDIARAQLGKLISNQVDSDRVEIMPLGDGYGAPGVIVAYWSPEPQIQQISPTQPPTMATSDVLPQTAPTGVNHRRDAVAPESQNAPQPAQQDPALTPPITNKQSSGAVATKSDIEILKQQRNIDGLIAAFSSDDPELRQHAIDALVDLRDEAAVDPLVVALGHADRHVRWAAAKTLGRLDSQRAISALSIALNDPSALVKVTAAEAINRLSGSIVVEQLLSPQQVPDNSIGLWQGLPRWFRVIASVAGAIVLLGGILLGFLAFVVRSNQGTTTPGVVISTPSAGSIAVVDLTTTARDVSVDIATPIPTGTPIPPTPTAMPRTGLAVASIPVGSEVFVASLSDLEIALSDDAEHDTATRALLGFRRLSDSDTFKISNVVNNKYRRGVTPLLLPLKPGNYVVFLSVPASVQMPSDKDVLDWFETDYTHGTTWDGLFDGHNGRAYLIEIVDGKINHLTLPWQRKGASLDEIEKIYPIQDTFNIDEQEIKAKIIDTIPDNDIPIVLRLLHKGGKVIYRDGKQLWTIEINPSTGSLWTFLGWKEN
jgi:hypothetical protein